MNISTIFRDDDLFQELMRSWFGDQYQLFSFVRESSEFWASGTPKGSDIRYSIVFRYYEHDCPLIINITYGITYGNDTAGEYRMDLCNPDVNKFQELIRMSYRHATHNVNTTV